jgi:hypothetical protein
MVGSCAKAAVAANAHRAAALARIVFNFKLL